MLLKKVFHIDFFYMVYKALLKIMFKNNHPPLFFLPTQLSITKKTVLGMERIICFHNNFAASLEYSVHTFTCRADLKKHKKAAR